MKKQLYQACLDYVQKRIDHASSAMNSAQEATQGESKSSAGDKHETETAMLHLEQEKSAKSLSEALLLKKGMAQFDSEIFCSEIKLGALAKCSTGNFYISVSAGKIEIDNEIYFAISPVAPIAQSLLGKKAGEKTMFNGREIIINVVL